MATATEAYAFIVASSVFGMLFAAYLFWEVSKIKVTRRGDGYSLLSSDVRHQTADRLFEIYSAIQEGARAFLLAEYTLCFAFIIVFGGVILVLTSYVNKEDQKFDWTVGVLTATAFAVGGLTSMAAGYMGMMVAVYSNARTTVSAMKEGSRGWSESFNTAFRAGGVMGFGLTSLALLVLFILIKAFETQYPLATHSKQLFEAIAGYGLGGSSIAMFGRVGGGIYTKAADVGADLAGKVVENIPEDDPRNPATIADNVGDNVGDVAGMGSDLFGSLAEATCATLVISTQSPEIIGAGWPAVLFPLVITATGIFVSAATMFLATHVWPVRKEKDVETVLKVQIFVSTLLMTGFIVPVAFWLLPANFTIGVLYKVTPLKAVYCVAVGLWGGCIVGFVTEYFTSHSYSPVREVAQACETGAATNIIYGLALGYKSAIIPITIISIAVYVGFSVAGMYGVALAALGFLGTLATCLAIDVYGPICDNAGGIAEMAELPAEVRDKTDALDAAGNTTAAIGKGFAIGSAALVSLALFGGFVTRIEETSINILSPITFAGLFMGAMLPYWFTAMTMKSVGVAAMEMVKEVKHQFATIPGLLEGLPGHGPPDHARCIKISTDASLREMIPPGLLVMLSPIVAGTFFGVHAVSGLLVGALTSGVQLAISQSNTGGAWDNAKKYVEKGCVSVEDKEGKLIVQGKGSAIHKAAVIGDTVGDPLKDTSGPALNILMKLMAIISLVFGDFFKGINGGRGLLNIPLDQVVATVAGVPAHSVLLKRERSNLASSGSSSTSKEGKMLPTAATRRKSAPENGWMLLPKLYVYLGVAIIFVVGVLFGSGYQQANVGHALAQQQQQYSITKPTVLVTGGLGFIGSHVVEDLLANGFHVVVYDDMSNGRNFNRGAAAVLVKDITVVNDYSFIVHKVDYIVHLAAAISVEESTRLPEKYERINVEGSRKVLDWAVKNGVKRVVAASSGATYGIPLPENLPLREDTATGGICAYATTKFKMEGLMKNFNRDFGLPSTALRFFNVYGPRQDPHSSYSGVVSWFMEQAKINGTLKVSGEGDQYRDFVYVKDVARAIRTAMLLNDKEFDVFNVCTGVKTTVKEVAEKIVETFGSSAAIKNVPWRNGDVKESVCSLVKSRDKLGFTAGYTFSEGISETRDWFMGASFGLEMMLAKRIFITTPSTFDASTLISKGFVGKFARLHDVKVLLDNQWAKDTVFMDDYPQLLLASEVDRKISYDPSALVKLLSSFDDLFAAGVKELTALKELHPEVRTQALAFLSTKSFHTQSVQYIAHP